MRHTIAIHELHNVISIPSMNFNCGQCCETCSGSREHKRNLMSSLAYQTVQHPPVCTSFWPEECDE